MSEPKKLIEVAMPIKEISAESVRDKSIRSGHISTLHLWWARRPLPVCRAVVFASLVPDPLDENCPREFKEAVELLLGSDNNIGDPYKPYEDIPFTSALDKMDDNLRNRLMMFIGKFSESYILNEKKGKVTATKDLISDKSLIKWESRNAKEIIGKAKRLIYVAYNSKSGRSLIDILGDYDEHERLINIAQNHLYSLTNRHIESELVILANNKYNDAKNAFLNNMPMVFDPFAGGGTIPLEAARLGCRSYGNDINPVAHIIQNGGATFPQKFGNRILYDKNEFCKIYGVKTFEALPYQNKIVSNGEVIQVELINRLSFDFTYFANKILTELKTKHSNIYNTSKKDEFPIAYYWIRHASCSNPTCKAEVPLLKQFYLSKRRGSNSNDWISLYPVIEGNKIQLEIKRGLNESEPIVKGSSVICPCCASTTTMTEVKRQDNDRGLILKQIVEIFEKNGKKDYVISNNPTPNFNELILNDELIPNEKMLKIPDLVSGRGWNVNHWKDLFNKRQLFIINKFIEELAVLKKEIYSNYSKEYAKAVITYLGIWIDRITARNTSFGIWHNLQETLEHPFGRQAIPMVFDFPEMNPFGSLSGAAAGHIPSIGNVIEEENFTFPAQFINSASGEKEQFNKKELDIVVTDPPYYDAIAYADLSDFFYVWLKRSIGNEYTDNFALPLTPKTEECTALKHHHNGDNETAKHHFESKLTQIFDVIETQTKGIVSIMFAHQSTEAWSTLCNSILTSRMNICSSWAVDTEVTGALKSKKAFLSSSVTVCAKPNNSNVIGDFQLVKKSIENTVAEEVESLYKLGFRGSDLLTACFGKAVREFGKYKSVEKSDGSLLSVAELLDLTKQCAFNALLKGFVGDEYTKFYIGWLQLNGLTETNFDDAAKFTKVGLSINVQDLFREHILIKDGNTQHLGSLKERIKLNSRIGEGRNPSIIDCAHKVMDLYSNSNRNNLLKYIEINSVNPESPIWRVITSLVELLPKDIDDHKLAVGLLTNKDQLIREAKSSNKPKPEQSQLTFE
jgi:putative DNA methylase